MLIKSLACVFGISAALVSLAFKANAQINSSAWYVGQTQTAHRFVIFDSIEEGDAPNTVRFSLMAITRDREMIATGNAYSFSGFETDCLRLRSRVLRWAMFNTTGQQILDEEEAADWSPDEEGSISRKISDALCGDQIPSSEVLSSADFNRFFSAAIGGGR